MRIRTYRSGDIAALVHIQQAAARFDGLEAMSEADLSRLLAESAARFSYNVFLITDDDDELITWSQGENLEGVEGEIIGYTILHPTADECAYHFRCHGAVLPEHRHRGVGHALVLCAMNHARMQAIDIINEARQQALPIYFEVELPANNASSQDLASAFELEESSEPAQPGLRVYRTEL
ncbi:MAG TPA: GNAT family N-acetyltransferase [Ktedonobacteraceae bacterium]|jgi:GNAT superfamily N-acetyltransferase|nr:GNAT family N-acetyltransferase [Ktedonobacteraceae bacterium]